MNELDTLDTIAAAADTGAHAIDNPQDAGQGEPGAALATGPDFGREAAGAVDMFAGLVVGYAPACASVWNDEAKARTAGALAPVLEKYGFTFGSMPPELIFAVVAGPLLWQSSRIVAAQMETEKAKSAPAQPPASGIEKAAQQQQIHTAPAPERHPQEALYK